MESVTIRILYEEKDGSLSDGHMDYTIAEFGGVMPSAGDQIFSPWVGQAEDRNDPRSRELWEIRRRIFNPRDSGAGYIALVVSARPLNEIELALMP